MSATHEEGSAKHDEGSRQAGTGSQGRDSVGALSAKHEKGGGKHAEGSRLDRGLTLRHWQSGQALWKIRNPTAACECSAMGGGKQA